MELKGGNHSFLLFLHEQINRSINNRDCLLPKEEVFGHGLGKQFRLSLKSKIKKTIFFLRRSNLIRPWHP